MTVRSAERVAVLMGGPSEERKVSLRSGAAVARGLCEAGYDAVGVDVTGDCLEPLPEGTSAVFIALHGAFGEDGGVQEALEALGMPYTGAGPEGSRVAFDKCRSKAAFRADGVPTPPYEILERGRERRLALPVVVKPPRQGSSIGVHIVRDEEKWAAAVEDAFRYGDEVLVEAFIDGMELTVGIVEEEVLPVVMIKAPDGDYSFEAKYTRGASDYVVPAPIGDELTECCRRVARGAFDAVECEGLGRVDVRCTVDGDVYVLEVNTIPGFTETSLLPMAAKEAGMSFAELCGRIMRTADRGKC